MSLKIKLICALITAGLMASMIVVAPMHTSMAAQKDKNGNSSENGKSKKVKEDKDDAEDAINAPGARPVLWTERQDIESLDLFHGPGGRESMPDPSGKYTFVRRSASGTSEKIIVDDDKGRSWTVKFGPEARPEVSASRIVWAAGYHVDPNFFVKETHIEGRGGFDVWDVRFERRDDGYKELGQWYWKANPFMGAREFHGLKVVMALLNNWDLKDENNKVLRPNKESGGDRSIRLYYVSDLGGTLGSTGNALRKIPGFGNAPAGSKGNPNSYAAQRFIDGVSNGEVNFHYEGKNPDALKGVTVENARWMGDLLGRLSDKQLADAFRAGGFTDGEVSIYVRAMRDRINQLKNLQ
jgi:hypothetical protein